MKRLVLVALAALLLAVGVSGSSASVPVAAPVNFAVTNVTQSSIGVAWGPTQPGPFSTSAGSKTQVNVSWGASSDSRGSVLYRVQYNGTTVATGLTATSYGFGFGAKVRSFRVCVQSYVGSLNSIWVCGTISR